MKPVVSKFRSFEEAEAATREYYRQLTPEERLEILFHLREMADGEDDASSQGMARVFESLNSNGVEYVVVGAVALAHHGVPRYTGDLDVLVRNSPENARRLEEALDKFGLGELGLKAADFLDSYRVIQLGVAPRRIDILTSLTGVPFDEAWSSRVLAVIDKTPVNLLGREALIQNKRKTGRAQDRADLEALGVEGNKE